MTRFPHLSLPFISEKAIYILYNPAIIISSLSRSLEERNIHLTAAMKKKNLCILVFTSIAGLTKAVQAYLSKS